MSEAAHRAFEADVTLGDLNPAPALALKVKWLSDLRWVAVAGLFALSILAVYVLRVLDSALPLFLVAGALAAHNVVITAGSRWLSRQSYRSVFTVAVLSSVVDLLLLALAIHYAGGVENPFIFLFVLHLIIASMLFSGRVSYGLAALVVVLLLAIALLEGLALVPHHHLHRFLIAERRSDWVFVGGMIGACGATCLFSVFLATRIMRTLRARQRDLATAYSDLQRHGRELTEITNRIADLIRQVEQKRSFSVRYENPSLRPCWEMLGCKERDCPGYQAKDLRCWQHARGVCPLSRAHEVEDSGVLCESCKVYQSARPTKITEIGESFNDMMVILQREAEQAEALRGQVAHQEKMAALGQMAAGIAHEVGNPLASISSLVQYLQRKVSDEKVVSSLKTVATHIERISRTVRQMVNFARPISYERREESINAVVEQAVKAVEYDPRFRNVKLEMDLSSYIPQTLVSADQIVQVFVNIIINALDAMPDGGKLSIESRYRHGVISVAFADTGTGMTAEQMKHIFEPFYTTKAVSKGTGLGLSVSYAAVQQYGGSIEVHSTPGLGSVFRVHLPVLVKAPHPGAPVAQDSSREDSHGGTDPGH